MQMFHQPVREAKQGDRCARRTPASAARASPHGGAAVWAFVSRAWMRSWWSAALRPPPAQVRLPRATAQRTACHPVHRSALSPNDLCRFGAAAAYPILRQRGGQWHKVSRDGGPFHSDGYRHVLWPPCSAGGGCSGDSSAAPIVASHLACSRWRPTALRTLRTLRAPRLLQLLRGRETTWWMPA